jgi:conflict system STAND superfamily ATPase
VSANPKPNQGATINGPLNVDGDFIGRDQINQYLIQVHVLQAEDAGDRYKKFSEGEPLPYRPDGPFRTEDEPLFAGREAEVESVLRQISDPERRSLAVYGPADVGKTSLLAAGVIPQLVTAGALVVHLSDYSRPVDYLRAALIGRAEQLKLKLPDQAALPDLARAIVDKTKQGLIFILDQFERSFLPDVPETRRQALRDALAKTMDLVEPRYFHLIVSAREEFQPDVDREWGAWLPDLRRSPVHIEPLKREQAKRAIQHPLEVIKRAYFDEKVIDAHLLSDLDNLDNQETGTILPADLQIVCYRLYEVAKGRAIPVIDEKLYFEASQGKGAEQIIDLHFERLLAQIPEPHRGPARLIAGAMLDPLRQFWIAPRDLSLDGMDTAGIDAVMAEMAEARLLIWHSSEGEKAYAFASNSIANAALRAAGPEAIRRQQARNELEYAWRAWVAYDAWASPEQLAHIEQYPPIPPVPPELALLLLRSAILRSRPTGPWSALLHTPTSARLIQQIETGNDDPDAGRLSRINQVRMILGATQAELPPLPAGADGFGVVSWAAATHPNPVCRETAALALSFAFPGEVIKRMDLALAAGHLGNGRRAELRGILSDANPEIAAANRQLPPLLRLGIWGWRFRRRVVYEAVHLGALTAGGALGAGLFLALMRALLSGLLQFAPGQEFLSNFPLGIYLGAALTAGVLLGRLMSLPPPGKGLSHLEPRSIPVMLITGGTAFMLMHSVLVTLVFAGAIIVSPLLTPLALVAGLALSLTVYDQPMAGWRTGMAGRLVRIGLAVLVFAGIQAVFASTNNSYGGGLDFVKFAVVFGSRMTDVLQQWGLNGITGFAAWTQVAAIIDSALCGLVLSCGLISGVLAAEKLFTRWKFLLDISPE